MKCLNVSALMSCAAVIGAGLVMAAPQRALADEKVNQLIVYGQDPCPPSTDNEITVCARKSESERYRIPEDLREDPNGTANQPWTQRVKAYETVGAFGTNSCSPSGLGGDTGCMAKLINSAYAERKQSSSIRFGKLIEAAREKRLKTVDSDAAAEQARVESIEKDYDAKLARERTAGDGASTTPAPGTPVRATLATPPDDTVSAGHH